MVISDKKIVDEVSGWLRVFDDGSVDRTWTGPPQVKFMSDPVPPHDHFIDGVAVRDVSVSEKSGTRVRIYLPEIDCHDHDHAKLPIIVHFHGGGFCISRADWFMYYGTYTRLAREARTVVVSVYLRLAPEHRLPAAADDGVNALLWLSSLARGEGDFEPWLSRQADFTRVFLIGDSSGGNLVHHVAARAGELDLGPLTLAGAIPVHPGFVRSGRSRSELEMPESPFLTLDMVDKFLSMALPVGAGKDHPYTCPMEEAMDGLRLPAMMVCVAEKDLIRDTEMEYYEALRKAGKDVELLVSPGMGHSFYLNKIAVDTDPDTAAQTDRLLAGIADFVRRH